MRKAVAVIAGLLLLLAFAQCKKEKINENQESDDNFELACNASEYIDDNIQSQLDLLNDKTTPEAMAILAEWIKGQEGVASVVAFDNRVEYVYVDGTKGSIMVYNQPDEDDLDYSSWSLMPTGNKLQHGNLVGNQKGFIYDAFPYTSSNYNPGDTIQKRFEERGFEYAHPREEDCTIDTLKAMFQYGFVIFKTHANSDVFSTGERVTNKKRKLYRESMENDLIREARLVIKKGLLGFEHKGRFFGVINKYIEGLQDEFDNAIIFMGACLGFPEENALLKDAFLNRRAATYFGFNNYVIARFTYAFSGFIVSSLFDGGSVGEAYDYLRDHDSECVDFEYEGEIITTCLKMDGATDITWYETPPVAPLPQVVTKEVENITATSALFRGTVISEEGCQEVVERGFCYGTGPGQFYGNVGGDGLVYEGSETEDFSCVALDLYPDMTYYVRAYAKTTSGEVCYGAELSFTTLNTGGDIYDYVDLGLPSGTLWATCNLGANAPEEYGNYFAWGETQPKINYSWITYQYCNGDWDQLTKYCSNSNYGYNDYTDNLTILETSDDAATANWGSGWRMPTIEDYNELYQNTIHSWTTQNGVNGNKFTALNGNSLFLPAAGCRLETSLFGADSYGLYWSSSLSTDSPDRAWYFNIISNSYSMSYDYRFGGFSVRPVRSAH